ncbi:MAG TPA: CBS domain-containing protein [Sedimentisphaerales bacterium]|nr:CBS domain-containing protein [Sedimentisphaerales bacterium]
MDRIIRDFMHRGVVTCGVDANAAEVAKTMLDNDVSALVVVDERLNACGVISKTDLVGFYGKELSQITAEDLMTSEVFTVSPDTLVYEAVQLMLEHRIHQLVIVTQGGAHRRPVGIFTTGDAVALMAGESGPRSEAQIRCSDCIRKFISIGSDKEVDGKVQ